MTEKAIDAWEWLKASKRSMSDEDIRNNIVNKLLELCFGDGGREVAGRLRDAMPLLSKELDRTPPGHHSFAIVTTVAVSEAVKFYELRTAKATEERKLIFELALLILYMLRDEIYDRYPTTESLLASYPEFQDVMNEPEEMEKLRCFANVMFHANALVKPPLKAKRDHLVELVTRATEGKKARYVFGSGATSATTRRLTIFRTETGTQKRSATSTIIKEEGKSGSNKRPRPAEEYADTFPPFPAFLSTESGGGDDLGVNTAIGFDNTPFPTPTGLPSTTMVPTSTALQPETTFFELQGSVISYPIPAVSVAVHSMPVPVSVSSSILTPPTIASYCNADEEYPGYLREASESIVLDVPIGRDSDTNNLSFDSGNFSFDREVEQGHEQGQEQGAGVNESIRQVQPQHPRKGEKLVEGIYLG
jgi:hypothetical protein